MKLVFSAALALLALGSTLGRDVRAQQFPLSVPGWIMAREGVGIPYGQTADFQIGTDTSVSHGGKSSAFIKSVKEKPRGFRAWTQGIKADAYRGKRVRLTGFVKTQEVATASGLWMRVDGANGAQLGFDNMGSRAVKGTTDWKAYSVVLDVPQAAEVIYFGSLLSGSGTVWIDDLTLETVDAKTVASTDPVPGGGEAQRKVIMDTLPSQGTDLGFEAAPADEKAYSGWHITGTGATDYEYDFTPTEKHTGKGSAFIKAKSDKPKGFRAWGQVIKANAYRGKRIRLNGYLKTDQVASWAGLWMNVINAEGQEVGFDNMHDGITNRALRGTADWQPCFVVLDVPQNAEVIIFGGLLSGSGTVWIDDLRVETVDAQTVAVTGKPQKAEPSKKDDSRKTAIAALPTAPLNLDFEK